MSELKKLPPHVQSLIRSGVAITNVSQCIEELVLNSIDAGATCIAVRLDISCCKIQVVDNGHGMEKRTLEKLAERYTTSKCHSLQDLDEKLQHYGYRGEALASIREIASVLEIQSRPRHTNTSYTRVFQNGRAQPVTKCKNQRPSAGTTVTIHDLYHRLPVRKKCLNDTLEVERARQRLEGLALIHPSVSLSFRNDATATKVLQTHKTNSVLGTFTYLYGTAKARMMSPVSTTNSVFDINGYIGKDGHHSKNLQFIFVNDRLVLKTKLHRLVNFFLSRSSISRKKPDNVSRFDYQYNFLQQKTSYSERHGIYILSITCPYNEYDITFDPSKTLIEFKQWRCLAVSVEKMVREFLRNEGLVNSNSEADGSPDLEGILGNEIDFDDEDEGLDKEEENEKKKGELNNKEKALSSLQKYAAGINTADGTNNLTSETVRRGNECNPEDIVKEIITEKTEKEKGRSTSNLSENSNLQNIIPSRQCTTTSLVIEDASKNISQTITKSQTQTDQKISQSSKRKNIDGEDISDIFNQPNIKVAVTYPRNIDSGEDVSNAGISHTDRNCYQKEGFLERESSINTDTEPLQVNIMKREISLPPEENFFEHIHPARFSLDKKSSIISLANLKDTSTKDSGRSLENQITLNNPGALKMPCSDGKTLRNHKSQDNFQACESLLVTSFSYTKGNEKVKKVLSKVSPSNNTPNDTDDCVNKIISLHNSNEYTSLRNKQCINTQSNSRLLDAALSGLKNIRKNLHKKYCNNVPENHDPPLMPHLKNSHVSQIESQDKEESHVSKNIQEASKYCEAEIEFLDLKDSSQALNSNGTNLNAIDQTENNIQMCFRKRPPNKDGDVSKEPLAAKLAKLSREKSENKFALASKLSKLSRTSKLENEPQKRIFSIIDMMLEDTQKALKLGVNSGADGKTTGESYGINNINYESQSTFFSEKYKGTDTMEDIFGYQDTQCSPQILQGPPDLICPEKQSPIPAVEHFTIENAPKDQVGEDTQEMEKFKCELFSQPYVIPVSTSVHSLHSLKRPKSLSLEDMSPDMCGIESNTCKQIPGLNEKSHHNSSPIPSLKDPDNFNIDLKGECTVDQTSFSASGSLSFLRTAVEDKTCFDRVFYNQANGVNDEINNRENSVKHVEVLSGKELDENHTLIPNEAVTNDFASPGGLDGTSVKGSFDDLVNESPFKSENEDIKTGNENGIGNNSVHPIQSKINDVLITDTEIISSGVEECNKSIHAEVSSKVDPHCHIFSRNNINEGPKGHVFRDGELQSKTSVGEGTLGGACIEVISESLDSQDKSGTEKNESETHVPDSDEKTLFVGGSWVCKVDGNTGQKVFINKVTGNSSLNQPTECDTSLGKKLAAIRFKNPYLPTGASPPIFKETSVLDPRPGEKCGSLAATLASTISDSFSKFKERHTQRDFEEFDVKWREKPSVVGTGIAGMLGTWENPTFPTQEQCSMVVEASASSKGADRVQEAIHPYKFDKDVFSNMKVLGQVDNKFIACLTNIQIGDLGQSTELMVIVDQHAAHERVRLEKLTEEAFSNDGTCQVVTQLQTPISVIIKEEYVRVIGAHIDGLEKLGLSCSTDNLHRDLLHVHSVPTCLFERDVYVKRRVADEVVIEYIEGLLEEYAEVIQETHGAFGTIPRSICRALNSQACHGAIKFGDPLSKEECENLIKELSQCMLPFQCAHGRPSVTPILDLDHLKHQHNTQSLKAPSLWKLRLMISRNKANEDIKDME